jgi:hypothetical protein
VRLDVFDIRGLMRGVVIRDIRKRSPQFGVRGGAPVMRRFSQV